MRTARTRACFLLAVAAGCAAPPPKVRTEQEIIHEAKGRVFPALVFVKPIVETYYTGEKQKVQVFGSGVIFDEAGHVVTNHHVVENASEVRCVLSDRQEVGARIVGLDAETDLAVLRLSLEDRKEPGPLPTARFASRPIRAGDLVMAMGAPHGYERSVSRGIISSTERTFEFGLYNLYLQTDAAINPGNSGGPLVDEHGEVVGINTFKDWRGENLGFSIPSRTVQHVVRSLIEDRAARDAAGDPSPARVTRAWLGIHLQPLKDLTRSSLIETSGGALVASVDPDSPAERAGLRPGDILLSCDGEPLEGTYDTDLPAIRHRLACLPPDRPAVMAVGRGPERFQIAVTPVFKGKHEGDDFDCRRWGMTVKEITKHSIRELTFHRESGVFIQAVTYDGNAAMSGLISGDIVVAVEGTDIGSLDAFQRAFEAHSERQAGHRKVLVRVLRQGLPWYVVLDFERDPKAEEDQ